MTGSSNNKISYAQMNECTHPIPSHPDLFYVHPLTGPPLFAICSFVRHPGPSLYGNRHTANVFTGTETLEFDDSTGTSWSSNILPSGVCMEIDGDADFTSDSIMPELC